MPAVMLVTGASRGIGAAVARLAGRRGYRVLVNYATNPEAAAAVVGEITAAGGSARALPGDVSQEADVMGLLAEVDREGAGLDVLVNNAGIVGSATRVAELDATQLARVLAVNVVGSVLCAREAVRRMSTRRGGRGGAIVNISSAAARHGAPGELVHYALSKAAIDTFTIGLAKEAAADGIRVNAVRPGLIYTDIHASAGAPDRVDQLKGQVPMQRGGQPEEVAEAVLWLASPAASYCTGSILDVAGGR